MLPLAVILPGISGSHLAAAGQRVWLNPGGICTGSLLAPKTVRMDDRPELQAQTEGAVAQR